MYLFLKRYRYDETQLIGQKQGSGRLSKMTAKIEVPVTSASISAVTLDIRPEPCFRPMDINVKEQMRTDDETTVHCCFLEHHLLETCLLKRSCLHDDVPLNCYTTINT